MECVGYRHLMITVEVSVDILNFMSFLLPVFLHVINRKSHPAFL